MADKITLTLSRKQYKTILTALDEAREQSEEYIDDLESEDAEERRGVEKWVEKLGGVIDELINQTGIE